MLFAFVLTFLLSFAGVGLLRRVLLAIEMFDHPGQRRLHFAPVPRGGGLAMVFAAVLSMLIASIHAGRPDLVPLNAGLILVAAIGWWDDRRGLGIAPRLCVHALSGLAVCWLLQALELLQVDGPALWALSILIVLSVVASINLHNFIDGANGMLGVQSFFVLAMLIALTYQADPALTLALLCGAGAVLGFLPWNFPKARIFMGDVGSGALGYLLAAVTLCAWAGGAISLPEAVLLNSVVLIDGLSTLLFRMASGRRWWQAHREHLYQWLVRTGRSHARVVLTIQSWNLLVVLPVVLWLHGRPSPGSELVATAFGLQDARAVGVAIALCAFGVAIRGVAKRRLLRAHRAKCRHERQNRMEHSKALGA